MRISRSEYMFITKLNIIQHVLTILDIDKRLQQLLIYQVIDSEVNMINDNYNINQLLVYNSHSKLFMVDKDQISIFQKWRRNNFIRMPTTC